MFWEEEGGFHFEGSEENESYTCNTRKDKDKRICRHSFGVLFGCSPCGVGKYLNPLFLGSILLENIYFSDHFR